MMTRHEQIMWESLQGIRAEYIETDLGYVREPPINYPIGWPIALSKNALIPDRHEIRIYVWDGIEFVGGKRIYHHKYKKFWARIKEEEGYGET